MRVLNLVSVPWYNACAHYALTVGTALRQSGAEVFFGGLGDSPVIQKARQQGFEILDGINFKSFNPVTLAAAFRRLKVFAAQKSIDRIISHRGEDRALAGLLWSLPHISVRADIRRPKKNPFSRWLNRKAIDVHVVSSEFMRGYYAKGAPVRVIPQPMTVPVYGEYRPPYDLRAKLGLTPDHILAGVVARLDPVKGHRHVMEAANLLAGHPEIKFLVSGEEFGVTAAELSVLLSPEAKENVSFMGRVDDAREIFAALDLGVIASTGSEAVCRVALEMMAFGLPVVGTDVHSIPETVIHRQGGYIVVPGSGKALASALVALSRNPELRRSFGAFNRRRVRENFSMESFAASWRALCEEILP